MPANLPNAALTPGVYTANLLFQGGGSSITVPITVQVGPSFEQVNGINFTMTQTGASPLPQNITIATAGTSIGFNVSFDTATGGNWLTVAPSGACCTTPRTLEVSVTAAPTMPAGTYTGEVIVYSGTTSMTVPVTLTVATPTTPYFDNVQGEMTFFTQTAAPHPPPKQVFQIRNAGAGTLNWSLVASTFDGGNWLNVSTLNGSPAPSGVAPEYISVGIVPGNLPNGGLVAGVFTGQLLLQAAGSSYTIPVSVDVATDVFGQMSGIDFTMPQAGANPLPQVLTVTSTGASIGFNVSASTANGGDWLTVAPSGACCNTPYTSTVTVNAPPTMAAGIYTGQISYYSGTVSETVPVTLTVAPSNTAFFDNVPGALSYSLATGAGNPPSQNLQILNRGTGTFNWTAQTSTFDGGNWLTVSSPSGTAPSLLSVGIVTANLPNGGLVAGLFTGQILFLAGNSSSVTVPVSVLVGGNGFLQINPSGFTMPQAGANPLPETLTVVGTGTSVGIVVSSHTGNGGNWLTVSPSGSCCNTPYVITATVSAPVGMAAGTYTGEIVLDATRSAAVIPVILTVEPSNIPFFDNMQGQMSFFAATAGSPASQTMQIRNSGSGLLNWTLTPITADGGNWLNPSVTSGEAPSTITVAINPQNLPNQGLVAGQFTGQLRFQSDSGSETVPVSVQLGPNIFSQQAGLNFSMAYNGSSPLSQNLNVTSSGTSFGFVAGASSGNGGGWLSISPSGACCSTPRAITFAAAGAPGGVAVPAGVHTGQAVFNATRSALTVPVTLSVSGTPKLTISKSHTGNFTAGQQGTYAVTVSNQSGASVGLSNGAVTVTETVPTGMTLVSMAGNNWTCPANPGNTCTRSDALFAGQSYDPITVTVSVAASTALPVTNNVSVSGGNSVGASASDVTGIVSKCDLNQDGAATITDLSSLFDQALGLATVVNDLNQDGVVNILDIQMVVNAATGLGCSAI